METSEVRVELPSKEEFSEALGSDFVVRLEDGREVGFQLFRIDPKLSNNVQESFSLMFRTPLDVPPEQGIRDFRHPIFGDISLFLVPVKQKEDHFVYEAVFNLLKI